MRKFWVFFKQMLCWSSKVKSFTIMHVLIKGFVWFTDGFRMAEGTGAGVYGQSLERKLNISIDKHATVFQEEVYAILARVYEI